MYVFMYLGIRFSLLDEDNRYVSMYAFRGQGRMGEGGLYRSQKKLG